MPFAQLPSSSGFVQPQAPDWTRFALQANENIERGGEMRARAGESLVASIDKAASQIDAIIKEHSPEAKMAKALKLEFLKAQTKMYEEYKQNPQAFEFKGGALQYRDPYKNILKGVQFQNAVKSGQLLDKRIAGGGGNPTLEAMRAMHSKVPAGYNQDALQKTSNPILSGSSEDTSSTSDYSNDALDAAALTLPTSEADSTDATDETD